MQSVLELLEMEGRDSACYRLDIMKIWSKPIVKTTLNQGVICLGWYKGSEVRQMLYMGFINTFIA